MPDSSRYLWFALLGALFAAVTQVVGKPASDRLGPNVASLVRSVVMTLLFVAVVAYEARHPGATGGGADAGKASDAEARLSRSTVYALALGGGVAAALSWFFGYKALSLAPVSKTYPIDKLSVAFAVVLSVIFLGERPSLLNWAGIGVMIGGALMVTQKS